jgi:hypothetical protein
MNKHIKTICQNATIKKYECRTFCNYCKNNYSSKSTLYKHYKICKEKIKLNIKDEKLEIKQNSKEFIVYAKKYMEINMIIRK